MSSHTRVVTNRLPQRITIKGCIITMLLLAQCFFTAQARPVDEVTESGKLVVFAYSDYAPYSWVGEDGPQGIDVEIARHFGKALGVEVNFLIRGADENFDDDLRVNIWKGDLIHGKTADVMMHAPFDRDVDIRNEFIVLTAPYFQEQMALVFNKAIHPAVETFGRFVSKPIAVEVDTAGDFFLSGAFRGQLQDSVQRGRTFADAQRLYLDGSVGALLGSRAQAEWVAFQVSDIESGIAQPPMPGIVRNGWPIGIAVKHDSRDLGYAVGDVLTELTESGQMQAIYARYGVEWLPPELE
jgi:ABC-type amino acid transport substrate-binding protein